MDDPEANQTPGENFNKIDLSALEAFQFGTQWTDAGETKKGGERASGEQARAPGSEGTGRRDRRPPRRTPDRGSGGAGDGDPAGYEAGGPGHPPRDRERRGPHHGGYGGGGREGGGEGHPRRGFDRERGGQRFERGGRHERGTGGDRFERGPRRPAGPPRPYESPVLELTFYPDDHGFNALVKAMRASCRTYELFEIARLILGKPERCVVVFRRRAAPGAPPEAPRAPLAVSVPSGIPFDTEDEAINYALEKHLDQFFSTETVEVEPPKGTFQFVNRCPFTKELLGPPNYHRYAQIVQQHYTTRGIRMPFERYKASIEVVRDPEAVNQWLESMRKITRFTFRGEVPPGETGVFDNLEDARSFLLRCCRERLVRSAESVRLAAKVVEAAVGTEAHRAMNGAVDMQRRFPLDTANALRGRLRRENFNIFKRGSKGITYVCAVRRKFRQPGQSFSETINRLIEFIDQNPMIQVTDLAPRLLGFAPPPAPASPAAAPAPGGTAAPASAPSAPPAAAGTEQPAASPAESGDASTSGQAPAADTAPTAPVAHPLTPEQTQALNRLMLDLRWLVSEGYVAEYSDGRLLAHPVMAPQAPKTGGEAAPEGGASKPEAAEAAAQPVEEPVAGNEVSEPTPAPEASAAPAEAPGDETPAAPESAAAAPEAEEGQPASSATEARREAGDASPPP